MRIDNAFSVLKNWVRSNDENQWLNTVTDTGVYWNNNYYYYLYYQCSVCYFALSYFTEQNGTDTNMYFPLLNDLDMYHPELAGW